MPSRFVLHDHRKPSPHFDLRLEEDGVLRSWAVPKGMPDDTSARVPRSIFSRTSGSVTSMSATSLDTSPSSSILRPLMKPLAKHVSLALVSGCSRSSSVSVSGT